MDPTLDYYARCAAAYGDRSWTIDMAWLRAELVAVLAPGARVLDLGCGAGRDVAAFAASGFQVVGLDACRTLLERAPHRGRLVRGDLRLLPFVSASCDGVWICASLLHLPGALAPAAVREAYRVLRPGGAALAALKEGEGEGRDADGRWFTYYTIARAEALFADAGLVPVRAWSAGSRTGQERRWVQVLARRPAQDGVGAGPTPAVQVQRKKGDQVAG